ncbi:MAG: hypothetical protein AB1627_07480 [Chloroflexota bacterium]
MHTRAAVAVIAAIVALQVPTAQIAIAGATLWTKLVAPLGHVQAMELAADGSHHILYRSETTTYSSYYATDRGGRWTTQPIFGDALDLTLDTEGRAWVLVNVFQWAGDAGVRIYHDQAGTMVGEDVTAPGAPGSHRSDRGALAVAGDGTVSVAWSASDAAVTFYRAKGAGGWGDLVSLGAENLAPRVRGVDLLVDQADVPHVIVSGAFDAGAARPEACDSGPGACTVDIAMTATPATTGIGHLAGLVDSDLDAQGNAVVVVRSDIDLAFASNAGGTWATEPVVSVNTSSATVSAGPLGPVVFFDSSGLRRADRGPGGWTVSPVTTLASDQHSAGDVDTGGGSHIAFSRVSWHDEGYVGDVYLVAPDAKAPLIGEPRATARAGKVVGSTASTRISWSASDALSGLARYQLQQSVNGGTWSTVSSTLTSAYADRSLRPGSTTYRFRVRGWDAAGNVSAFVTGPTITMRHLQESSSAITYSGTWARSAKTAFSGGAVRYAASKAASATIKFTGRGFSLVSTYASSRGYIRVFVDGVEVPAVKLNRSSTTYRVVAYSISWITSAPHTIVLRPAGTAGHPRVDLDAILVIK